MGKNSGILVETKSSAKGIIYNEKPTVEGRFAVYLVNDDFSPKLGSDGKQLKMLCRTYKQIGFND